MAIEAQTGPWEQVTEIVRHFRSGSSTGVPVIPSLPLWLENMRLLHAERTFVAGRELSIHRYGDGVGHEVAVFQGPDLFEPPEDADLLGGSRWTLHTAEATVFASGHPVPSLVVGHEPGPVFHVVAHLGLE